MPAETNTLHRRNKSTGPTETKQKLVSTKSARRNKKHCTAETKTPVRRNTTETPQKQIAETNSAANFNIKKSKSGTGPSDHTTFYLQDIPVLHFFTGAHEDYHKPSDDAEKINYQGIIKIIYFIQNIINDLHDAPTLAFTKTKEENNKNE